MVSHEDDYSLLDNAYLDLYVVAEVWQSMFQDDWKSFKLLFL